MNVNYVIGKEVNITVYSGNSWKQTFIIQDINGNPVPLTNANMIMQFKRSHYSVKADAEFSLIDGSKKGLIIGGEMNNEVTVGDFIRLSGGLYKFDLLIVLPEKLAFTGVFGNASAKPQVSSFTVIPTADTIKYPPIIVKLNAIYDVDNGDFIIGDEKGNPIVSGDGENTIQAGTHHDVNSTISDEAGNNILSDDLQNSIQ